MVQIVLSDRVILSHAYCRSAEVLINIGMGMSYREERYIDFHEYTPVDQRREVGKQKLVHILKLTIV